MLAGKMSNHDEDEVEDELEALEAEMSGTKLPDAPSQELPTVAKEEETAKERARRRARERAEQAEPMLA